MAKDYWNGPAPLSLEQAAAVPYATIGVRIGDSRQALMVLASDSSGDLLWVSGHQVSLTTRNGRIIRSAGFDHNLTGFIPNKGFEGADTTDPRDNRRLEWLEDFSEPTQYNVEVRCERVAGDIESINLLGKQIQALKITEQCEAPAIGWNFVNTYWVGPSSGFVWRSIQYIHPNLDPIEIQTLRPPEG